MNRTFEESPDGNLCAIGMLGTTRTALAGQPSWEREPGTPRKPYRPAEFQATLERAMDRRAEEPHGVKGGQKG